MDDVPSLEACRICANFYVTTSEVDFLNIFEPTQPLQNEMVFIESELRAWQLDISCNDGLPQRICGNCFTKFCSIYAFREECIEAQQKLMQAFVEGDCAEEIVTAQDTTFNGLLPSNLKVEGEETMGLESMLVGGHVYEQPAKFEDIDSDMKESIEMMQPAETTQPPASITSHQLILSENTLTKDAEQTRSNTLPQEMQTLVAQDLEEVLQENYIPKLIKTKLEEETDAEDNDANSSLEEEYASNESEDAQNHLACQYCYSTQKQSIVFSSDDALSQHFFDAHDPTYPYTCPECPQKFNNSKSRLLHVKHKHQRQYLQTQKERSCQYCGKKLHAMTREEHIETCQHIGDWQCKECGLKFQQVTHFVFRSHMQREHASQKKQLVCKDCNRVFTQRTLWENHLALHKRNTVLWCNECKEAFADTYELRKHKYKMHNGELPVNCDHCKKGFVTYAFLHRHMQIFHPEKLDDSNDEAHLKCKNCGLEFSSTLKLRNHQQRLRDENGKCIDGGSRSNRLGAFPCPHCAKRFNMRAELDKHLLLHDTSIKRSHKCEICFVMFRSPAELRQHHEIAHLSIKSFSCETCGKKFAYKKDMREHMLCHEERHIPCSEPDCGFICKNEKVHNDHIRQKHRLLPCEYCNQTFTRYRLNMHLRQVHKVEIDIDVENVQRKTSASQDKVVVQFVGSRATNGITLNDQPAHQYPRTSATNYNSFDNYGSELTVEQEHEIVVT